MIQKALQNLFRGGPALSMDEFGLATGTSLRGHSITRSAGDGRHRSHALWQSAGDDIHGLGLVGYLREHRHQRRTTAQMIVTTPGASTYTLTALGQEWVNLMNEFSTHTTATVTAGATINFNGFYGNYNIGGQSVFSNMNLVKGTTQYSLALSAPPQWSFWNPASSGT